MSHSTGGLGDSNTIEDSFGPTSSRSSRTAKGSVRMTKLTIQRSKGIKTEVQFNDRGQPIGQTGSQLQSHIGSLVREHCRLSMRDWKSVPNDVKEQIWESVQMTFIIPDTWRESCMTSAATKFRTFRNSLYEKYILPCENDPDRLMFPPPKYDISPEEWSVFVIYRQSAIAKKMGDKFAGIRSMNKYDHHLSCKGYARLREEMKHQLTYDDDINRAILWKVAHRNKDGSFADEELATRAAQIDERVKMKEEGSLDSLHLDDDILTQVLEKPDNRGRVRGVGAHVKPSMIKSKAKGGSSCSDRQLLQKMAEMQAKIERLEQGHMASCSAAQSVDDHHKEDDVAKARDRGSKKKAQLPSPAVLLDNVDADEIPGPLKTLLAYASHALTNEHTISIVHNVNIFGYEMISYILTEDITAVCNKKPIRQNVICVYMGYLYKHAEDHDIVDRVRFVDPSPLDHRVEPIERGKIMGTRLVGTSSDQLVLVPCNVGEHWVLFVVNPHAEKVYFLDPLYALEHVGAWHGIMTMAIRMFNTSLGRRGEITHYMGKDQLSTTI